MTAVEPTNDLETLLAWKGKSQSSTESLSAATLTRLQNTLNKPGSISDGDVLPPLWHFVTHLESVPNEGLGRDGHPKRGGFLPPVALPRRMWAGGRLSFTGDLRVGDEVTKTSTIDSIVMKDGRSGPLCFVTVSHEFTVDGELRISEEQDLVYREDPGSNAPKPQPKPAPAISDWSVTVEPSEVMLFRYSALTFNAHRIHYDRDYAKDVEGYEGLVFHGPLTASLLADLAVAETGRSLGSFSFRAMSPLFDTAPFTINGTVDGDTAELWAATPSGGLGMQATATFR